MLTWSRDETARLWDVTKPEPLQTFKHEGAVIGAQFSRDQARVLTWSRDRTARLWATLDPLGALTLFERVLEMKVRTGMTLDQNLNLETLQFGEWQETRTSAEYQEIQRKIAARK